MNLVIEQTEKQEVHFLSLHGEVDIYTSGKLKNTLLPLTEKENREIVVNLTGVTYIDSTGLGIFIGALKSTHQHKSTMKLVGLNERIRRLFQITGLDEVINIEESTREEAK